MIFLLLNHLSFLWNLRWLNNIADPLKLKKMKKQLVFLIILLLLMTVCIPTVKAQVFLTLEPSFFQTGILYNQRMDKIGLYSRVNYGNIKQKGFYTDNVKVGIGMSIPISKDKFALYFGPNYNYFFDTSERDSYINIDKVHSISIDIGISRTKGRFTILMMSDLPNWESLVGFSYRFGHKHKAEQEVCKIGKKRFKHFN